MSDAAATPPAVELEYSRFEETLEIVALRIAAKQCTNFLKRLAGHIFHRSRVKPIITDADDPSSRLLLLAETISGVELAELPKEQRDFVHAEGAQPRPHSLRLGYEHLSAEQALRRVLPSGMEVPSAFEQIGHVAHLNLRDEHGPYKSLIGRILLDKNTPRIRSIVNKIESISNEFRVFPMEVLAGESDLRTTVRENGARFQLDFREVYWNSRLETEHKRILELLPANAVVCDGFAGIGPFAVPAALRGCAVYANDLNPKSHEYLAANVAANKVGRLVRTYNLCGRAFIRGLTSGRLVHGDDSAKATGGAGASSGEGLPASLPFGFFSHVLMNLPASALTFLDAFVGAFDRRTWRAPLPAVHCYCFSKASDPAAEVIGIAEQTMGCKLPGATVHVVRDVSPHKLMLCLEFTVPDEVAWAADGVDCEEEERAKRQRTEAEGEA
jgi:tRNA (guanine37-N1)-methyltransferase